LADVLREQNGITMTSGFGAGVQLQGLNPDYTIILIDGEPLIGRTAGVLDLNRIAVGNIKKIEIVKGPSSSLYGSEAMAGVINIITDKKNTDALSANIRYGSYNTKDGNISIIVQMDLV
jgi:outer membrane receptor for ferrienterochelin and colicins